MYATFSKHFYVQSTRQKKAIKTTQKTQIGALLIQTRFKAIKIPRTVSLLLLLSLKIKDLVE